MTITAIGYGDITPVSQLEYLISVISQLLGAVLWAAAVSQLAGIYANLDPHETAWKQSMDALNYFLHDRNCDPLLARRVREFLIASKQTQRRQRESGILLLMSPALQGEVAQQSHQALLNGIYYFRGASSDFVLQISLAIQTRCFAPREMVWPPHLHVVYTGLAAVRGVIKMRSQVWNEDFIVYNTALRRGGPACALTFLEVFQLERELLFDLLESAAFAHERYCVKRAALLLAIHRWLVLNHSNLKVGRQSPRAASPVQGVIEEVSGGDGASPGFRPSPLSVPESDLEEEAEAEAKAEAEAEAKAAEAKTADAAETLSGGEREAQDRSSRGGVSQGGPLDIVTCGKPTSPQSRRRVLRRQNTFGSQSKGLSARIALGLRRSLSSSSLPPVTSMEGYWGDTLTDNLNTQQNDSPTISLTSSVQMSASWPRSSQPQYSPLDGSVGLNSRTAMPSPMPSPSGGIAHGRHEARQESRLMHLSATVAELARQQARMLSMLETVTSSSRSRPHSPPHEMVPAAEASATRHG